MKKKFWSRKSIRITLAVIALLLLIRLALPSVILHYANKRLASMNGYYGHIEDIDIALIRGAYQVNHIYLNKVDTISSKQTPFFSVNSIDLSIEWKALLHGSIVGELEFDTPKLMFIRDKVEPKDLRNDSTDFTALLDDFMPLAINRFEIHSGNVHYIDSTSAPKVDVELTRLHVLALNLKNSYDSTSLLPARITASADVYEGMLDVALNINPLASHPTFDMNVELQNTNLVLLNEFFQAYAKIDVNKGTFGLYCEVAAKDGKFSGYVKPLIKQLDVVGKEDRNDDNFMRKLWENVVGTMAEVFENQRKDQFATKVPLEGDFNDPQAGIISSVFTVLQNAFIQALQPAIDYEIDIKSVDQKKEEDEGLLKRIFKKDKKKTDKS